MEKCCICGTTPAPHSLLGEHFCAVCWRLFFERGAAKPLYCILAAVVLVGLLALGGAVGGNLVIP